MYSSASQFWLAPMDEVLVDILGFTVPLAVRLEGVRGHFFVANALFYRDADVCLNYVDPKHQFRFGANLLAQPDGLHVQVSRTLWQIDDRAHLCIESEDFEYLEHNLTKLFLERDPWDPREPVSPGKRPHAVLFSWRF